MRILSVAGGGVAGLGVLLATLSTATSANTTSRLSPYVVQRGVAQRANVTARRSVRPHVVASGAPTPCPTDYADGVNGFDYIVGVNDAAAQNSAGGQFSAVGGGEGNSACATDSGVTSGNTNTVGAGGMDSFVAGGGSNTVLDEYSNISGGYENFVANPDPYTVIGGGVQNKIDNIENVNDGDEGADTIAGGYSNSISGAGGNFIGGGANNTVLDDAGGSAIAGGYQNTIGGDGYEAAIGGGYYNYIGQSGGFIGSGGSLSTGNAVEGSDAFVGSGDGNAATGNGSVVGGGGTLSAETLQVKSRERRPDLRKGRHAVPAQLEKTSGNIASGGDSFLGAGDNNQVSGLEAFLGSGIDNSATGADSALGGGYDNTSAAPESFLGGGQLNTIASTASYAAIAGGLGNSASGTFSAVLGGGKNAASSQYATVLGGAGNTASGAYALIAGGDGNTAAGELSFAGGYHADAANNGSFVWSDYKSGSAVVKDPAANSFVARASGGVTFYSNEAATAGVSLAAGSGTWASLSDRNAKTAIVPLDDDSVLAKVTALPVSTWSYKSETGVRHVGPMAQDFYAAFGVGADSRHITSIDEDGVALAAIKALDGKLVKRDVEIARLHGDNGTLHAENARLQQRLDRLEAKVDALSDK